MTVYCGISYGEMYVCTKPIYQELTGIRGKDKRENFAAAHDGELRQYHLSKRKLKELLGDVPVAIKAWEKELTRIQQESSDLYLENKPQQEFLMRLWWGKSRIDRVQNQMNTPKQTIKSITPERR